MKTGIVTAMVIVWLGVVRPCDAAAIQFQSMNEPPGSLLFFKGNGRFLTRKLWGAANEPPFFHHGMFTTLRESVLPHGGEAAQYLDSLPVDDAIYCVVHGSDHLIGRKRESGAPPRAAIPELTPQL